MNTVTSCFGANIDDRIAHALGPSKKELIFFSQTNAANIDQGILRVAGMKINFAANRRHTKSIAIAGNTTHHTFSHRPVLWLIERTEAQRIEDSYRPGSHGENIPQNSTHTGGCTLIGLDIRRMIMRLNLKNDGQPIADVHHASIFARPLNQIFSPGRELF